MNNQAKLKNYWKEKVLPNRKKIAYRVIRAGAIYFITGPSVALAFNLTEVSEGYGAIAEKCLGDTILGFLPVPKSYLEGTLCAAMLLTCGAAASQGLGNGAADAACMALMRGLSKKSSS